MDDKSTDNNVDSKFAAKRAQHTKDNIDMVFRENEKLIYGRAWHYARLFKLNFEDVKSQGFLLFCTAVEIYDGSASFSTHLYYRLNELLDYCKEEKSVDVFPEIGENFMSDGKLMPQEKIVFYELVEQLSENSRIVVHGLLQGYFEKPEAERLVSVNKHRVEEIMMGDLGWARRKFNLVWNEIQRWWIKNEMFFIS